VYSASGVLSAGEISGHLEYVEELAARLASRLGFELECIDFGGGFGIPYAEEEPELDLAPVAEAAARLRKEHPNVRFLFESGRYIVGQSGVFLTRVVRVKESRGRVFVICDGGMNSFLRPVFMRIAHPVRLVNRAGEAPEAEFDVCGPICTPIDVSGRGVRLPRPGPGDVVGFFSAGAYGYTMSILGFMSRGRPAELLAGRGRVLEVGGDGCLTSG
jgi:diaminopimelate decarboxylase